MVFQSWIFTGFGGIGGGYWVGFYCRRVGDSHPDEFVNLWDRAELHGLKMELTKKLVDRIVSTRDPLPVRKKPY